MNHRQLVGAAARRFPDLTQRQIEDVLAVFVELWTDELTRLGGRITVRDFGTLKVEVQLIRPSGAIRRRMRDNDKTRLTRLYFRFRPSGALRRRVEETLK